MNGQQSRTMQNLQTKALVLLWISLLASACAFASELSLDVSQYAHAAWKIREGFTKGTIFSIAQTPDGYLWLGTEFGLVRFDGVQAIPWQPPGGQALPGDYIRDLLVSRDGTLWIGTFKGLASWKDGKLTEYPEVAGHPIGPFLEDRKGTVWVAVQDLGTLCQMQKGAAKCDGSGTFARSITALYEDRVGNLWVSGQTGLWRWAPGPPEHYSFPREAVGAHALLEDENGALLMATGMSSPPATLVTSAIEAGLKELVAGKIRGYDLPGTAAKFKPTRLFRSSDGSLWVGTVQGLLHLHQGLVDKFDGLSGDVVTAIFEDREGSVWVSTQDGLDRFRAFAVPTISVNQGLSNSAVHVLQATPDGAIWIATADGLDRWQNGHITVYGKQKVPGQNAQTDKKDFLVNARVSEVANSGLRSAVYSLGEDDRGRPWAGTADGVFYLDHNQFVKVPGIPGGNIFAIAGDGHGKVWVSNQDYGLFYAAPQGAIQRIPWERFGHKYAAVALLPDPSKGGVWLGFFDGGMAYFRDGQIHSSYGIADGLGKGAVSDLQWGSDGAVWAATEGGLSRVKDGRVTTVTRENGLPCDAVHWVIEDNDHSFWLNMPCGLVRIARSELEAFDSKGSNVQTTTFDGHDGVRSRAFAGRYGRKVTKSLDGKIWFSPLDGVSIIAPRHLPFNRLPPTVCVQQIAADDEKYDASQGVHLPARVRNVAIDYTALSLVVPERVRFRFKLEGEDNNWREVVNKRHVEYSNLGPGHYRFRVTACNNSGVWDEAGAFLDFSVAPAYWETNWFRVLSVAAFAALLWAVHRFRVRILERRKAVLERHQVQITALNERLMKVQEEERTRIAGELHDGVLQRITSVSLRLGAAALALPTDSGPGAEVREVERNLIDVGAEIRQLSHELHPAALQEAGLPEALSSYCEEFTRLRGIPVLYEGDNTVKELSPGVALCLYRIAQEALGNVAKHARAKQAQVRLTRINEYVRLLVSDDGVGFDPSRSETSGGLGLINMRERVRQLDGTFEFASEPGRGTTIRVELAFRSRRETAPEA